MRVTSVQASSRKAFSSAKKCAQPAFKQPLTHRRVPCAFEHAVKRERLQPVAAFFGAGRKSANDGKMTVAITGATGLIGSRLVAKLLSEGHTVKVLTRNVSAARIKLPYSGIEFVESDNWESAIKGCYGVVNLAGEPIASRWDERIKREIKSSRVNTTKRLASAINSLPASDRPKAFISASAIGYYGASESATFKEDSPSGNDYLAEICREWEQSALEAKGPRTVILRTGIVLAREGGALAKMIPIFQLFSGGPLGSGNQWMSWIHRDDLINLILVALKDVTYSGVYNGTAPNPVRMSTLCSSLGAVMGRPSWLPVPDFALQGLLGEGAKVVLEGQKVLPAKAQQAGFKFRFSEIDGAVANVMGR